MLRGGRDRYSPYKKGPWSSARVGYAFAGESAIEVEKKPQPKPGSEGTMRPKLQLWLYRHLARAGKLHVGFGRFHSYLAGSRRLHV